MARPETITWKQSVLDISGAAQVPTLPISQPSRPSIFINPACTPVRLKWVYQTLDKLGAHLELKRSASPLESMSPQPGAGSTVVGDSDRDRSPD